MFSYLDKFNKLPQDLRSKVSNPITMGVVNDLEKKYNIDLAALVMQVMVKDVAISDLALFLASEFSLGQEVAEQVDRDLKEKVFLGVADYLGLDLSQIFSQPVVKKDIIEPAKESMASEAQLPEDVDDYSPKVEAVLNEIMDQANLKISPALEDRFHNALRLYVREVRSKIDTRDLLIKSTDQGGLGLKTEGVDKILKLADEIKERELTVKGSVARPNQEIINKINEMNRLSARHETDYDLSKILDTKHELAGGLDLKHELQVPAAINKIPAPASAPVFVPSPIVPQSEIKAEDLDGQKELEVAVKEEIKILEVAKKPEVIVKPQDIKVVTPEKVAINKLRPLDLGKKLKIEDIKQVKIMNPIDELKFMDITNFRRLARTPEEITAKIKNRVKLLEAEDYEKGLAGVTAWRQSPVNKNYLKILNVSINQGLTIAAAIEELKKQSADCLTMEEVEAIITLNKDLRF